MTIAQKDLQAEEAISLLLQNHFRAQRCERSPVGDKTYDVKLWLPHGGEVYCEIKTDWASAKTGNAFFEIENTRRRDLSGLACTVASFWAHALPGKSLVLLVDPKAMLWWLRVHREVTPRYQIRLSSPLSGDGNSQGYIVPVSLLLSRDWIAQIPFGF